jgi:hypothetical protein
MTTDERIQALTMNLEVLTSVHQDFEKRMVQYAADVKDAITRLTNIAASHDADIDDHDMRLEKLEGK